MNKKNMFDYSEVEYKILDQLSIPYVYFPQQTDGQKVVLSRYIMTLNEEELLIPSSYSFSYSAIIAGLTEKQVEYVAKNAPENYKKELVNSFLNETRMNEVFEIAKMMDEDLGNGVTKNQQRIKNVQQYMQDNWAAFQF